MNYDYSFSNKYKFNKSLVNNTRNKPLGSSQFNMNHSKQFTTTRLNNRTNLSMVNSTVQLSQFKLVKTNT